MKLTSIKNASSCLPKKEEGVALLLDKNGKEYAPLKEHFKWGKNVILSTLEQISIEMDEVEIIKTLIESERNQEHGSIGIMLDYGRAVMLAKAIIQSQNKIIVMRRVE